MAASRTLEPSVDDEVVVVVGVGGMGRAISRRIGSGKTLLIADVDQRNLGSTADALSGGGYRVHSFRLDVTCAESVSEFAIWASEFGPVTKVAHTSGLSPAQAPAARILAVDLLGVALLLEHFAEVIAPGGAGVVIASMAGHLLPPLDGQQRKAIVSARPNDLLALPFLNPDVVTEPGWAYAIAKQAAIVRVGAAAVKWGRRNARINSISPGTIATPMGYEELASPYGDGIRAMVTSSPLKRMGTPDEIAAASAFLLGSDAAFITGTDLLVDGGVTASAQTTFVGDSHEESRTQGFGQ